MAVWATLGRKESPVADQALPGKPLVLRIFSRFRCLRCFLLLLICRRNYLVLVAAMGRILGSGFMAETSIGFAVVVMIVRIHDGIS